MKGILLATGPRIAPNTQLPDVDNVHIYPLVLNLLGLQASGKIDGDIAVLGPYLMADPDEAR